MLVLVAAMFAAPFVYLRLQRKDNTVLASMFIFMPHFFL